MQSLVFAIAPLVAASLDTLEFDPAPFELELSDGLSLIRVLTGNPYDHFGDKIFVLPDGDGDGVADVAISSRPWVGGLTTGIGHVSIRSGRTLAERFTVVGEEHVDRIWGEGIATDPLGQVIAVGPDENDDGVADLHLLGGDSFSSVPYVRVVSGTDGAVIRREAPPTDYRSLENRRVGSAFVRYLTLRADRRPSPNWSPPTKGKAYYSRVGVDLDMDGHNDPIHVHYVEGAATNTWPARQTAMDLFVADGKSKELRWQRRLKTSDVGRVSFVGELGDLDGDGVIDLGTSTVDGKRGSLTLRSGKDGSVLATAAAPERWSFGAPAVSLGDVRGDGSTILLVGDHENVIGGECSGAVFVLVLRLPPR